MNFYLKIGFGYENGKNISKLPFFDFKKQFSF